MKVANHWIMEAARILLGLVFFVFGLNGFIGFMPAPPVSDQAGQFLGGLAASGYFFPLLKVAEIASGVLLLSKRFVPLALTVLAPIVVNIFAFHLFLEPSGLPMAGIVLGLELYLAWAHRSAFRSVLQSRTDFSATRTAARPQKPLVDSPA